jgi:ubiquitin-conjugating enzyme E2 D/E
MIVQRLNKELAIMAKEPIENCSAGPIGKDIMKWQATIFGPKDTPYEGGVFNLNIDFTEQYPYKPPVVYFTTPIYHCNVNSKGGICLDILNKSWSPALTINKLLISICSLLAEPNPNDPLVPHIAKLFKANKKQHDINARDYTIKYA